jgi:hypothetical protein
MGFIKLRDNNIMDLSVETALPNDEVQLLALFTTQNQWMDDIQEYLRIQKLLEYYPEALVETKKYINGTSQQMLYLASYLESVWHWIKRNQGKQANKEATVQAIEKYSGVYDIPNNIKYELNRMVYNLHNDNYSCMLSHEEMNNDYQAQKQS